MKGDSGSAFQHKTPRVRETFLLLLLAFLALGLYYPACNAPYCNLDDNVLEMEVLNNSSWSYVKLLFGPNRGGIYGGAFFRPFSTLVYWLMARVLGLEPGPFHLFNILIHLGNGLLIYFLIKRLYEESDSRVWLGFTAAMVFLVHPVNVEAVAWISGRVVVLSTFFILLAFSLHLRARRELRDWHLWAAAFCYLLSLLTYELAAAMPLAFIYWDREQSPQLSWRQSVGRCYRRWLLYGLTLTGYVVYRFWRGLTAPDSGGEGGYLLINVLDSFMEHVSSPFVGIGLYLKKVFWPWPLNLHISDIPQGERALYLVLGVLFLVALAWWIWKRSWVRFWAGWFLCGLLVVLPLSFHPYSWSGAAERYVYLSSIAFAVSTSLFVFNGMRGRRRPVARAVQVLAVGLVLLFAFGTALRASMWRSNEILMRDTWEKSPADGKVAFAYGYALHRAGKTEESIRVWRRAMELGHISEPAGALGYVESKRGNYAAAEKYYLLALRPPAELSSRAADGLRDLGSLRRKDPGPYLALADLHWKMADEEPDRQQFHEDLVMHFHERACQLAPDDAHLRYLLAKAYLRCGRLEEARTHFAGVSEMAPHTYYGKAAAKLARAGQVDPRREMESPGSRSVTGSNTGNGGSGGKSSEDDWCRSRDEDQHRSGGP